MSKHRRREVKRSGSGLESLLNGMNLVDILNILGKVDINKISSLINNSGYVANVKNENQPKTKAQKSTEQNPRSKEENTAEDHKDATIDNEREKIVNAISVLANADRGLLLEVISKIFEKDKIK